LASQKKEQRPPDKFKLEDIEAGLETVKTNTSPDSLDEKEREDAESGQKDVRLKKLKQRNKDLKSDRGLRENFASQSITFLWCYSIATLFILLMQGFPSCPFELPVAVMVTLIGTNAAATIGLVSFVPRGLFKNR
jgi:uncharacterized membrane protein YbhN (UPF0104 family)